MFEEVVEIETEFIIESLPCRLIGMNGELMEQYIKFVSDRLLKELGYPVIYGEKNPFPFMENISLKVKQIFSNKEFHNIKRQTIQILRLISAMIFNIVFFII